MNYWNSPAAVIRVGESALASTVAVGRVYEMVELLLATPVRERVDLRLRVEGFEHPLDLDSVRALRERSDYPVTC
jgi:hypothetical protein